MHPNPLALDIVGRVKTLTTFNKPGGGCDDEVKIRSLLLQSVDDCILAHPTGSADDHNHRSRRGALHGRPGVRLLIENNKLHSTV